MDSRRPHLYVVIGIVAAFTGCMISGGDVPCGSSADCPALYSCVSSGAGVTRSICQPAVLGASGDAGPSGEEEPPVPDAGVGLIEAPFYCHSVKRFLDKYCIACHGPPPNASGIPTFRLDVYNQVGEVLGVKDVSTRIQQRIVGFPPMPPPSFPNQPRTDEKRVVDEWASTGAPDCDAGTP
jgi:hypothetical protein